MIGDIDAIIARTLGDSFGMDPVPNTSCEYILVGKDAAGKKIPDSFLLKKASFFLDCLTTAPPSGFFTLWKEVSKNENTCTFLKRDDRKINFIAGGKTYALNDSDCSDVWEYHSARVLFGDIHYLGTGDG